MAVGRPKNRAEVQASVLDGVQGLLRELGSARAAERATLESSLERDLGLGSLERVELLVRLERALDVRLPENAAQAAETPGDWARIAMSASSEPTARARWPIRQPSREAYEPPAEAASFAEVLRTQVERDPARVHIHLLDQDSGRDISHGQLYEGASRVAAGLVASGLRPGETVAVMLPTCVEFFDSFLGIMLAGGIAVPVYPPTRPNQIEAYIRRQALILRNAGVRFLISFDRIRAVANVLDGQLPALREVVSASDLALRGKDLPAPAKTPPSTFFIQYTSGSTGDPKGVTLTHSNVLANIRGIGFAVEANPSDTVVSWLPLYHDMGLIGSWLFSLYYGLPITVLSPIDFLVRPERWLWALSDSGGTLCPAPNFAFELCLRKISDEAMEGVDLSPWRVAINAGEPVLPATLRRFADRFERWGFDSRSFMPFYGLAESSVALTYPPFWRGPVVDRIDRSEFEAQGRATACADTTKGSREVLQFVGNGKPLPGHEIRIVGDKGEIVPDRNRGTIHFRGPSRTNGYFRNPEATAEVLDSDGWLDSGDLGYVADGELYVTGRLKDCIIKGGRNIIPQDVEMTAWEVEGVRKGCVAAFGCMDPDLGTELLVLVVETRVTDEAERKRIQAQVTKTVADKLGIPPDDVALAHPGFVPKTSSGKIQRLATRKLYLDGEVTLRPRTSVWTQMAKVWIAGTLRSSTRLAVDLGARFRRGSAAVIGSSLATTFGLVARLAPSTSMAHHVISPGARVVSWLAGATVPPKIGVSGAGIVLVSRAHRLDPLVVAAACRSPFVFADRLAFRDLDSAQAFLLEPLVASASGNGRGPSGVALLDRMEAALNSGLAVVSFSDSPVGEPPARTRFRAENFAAAASAEIPLIPVLLRNQNGNGTIALEGPPVASATRAASLAASRQQVRSFLEQATEKPLG